MPVSSINAAWRIPLPDESLPFATDPEYDPTAAAAVSAPARPLTPRVRRRLWAEPHVRGWWLTALLVAVLVGWLIAEQIVISHNGAWRAAHWRPVRATIEKIEAGAAGEYSTRNSYIVTPDDLRSKEAILGYTDAAGVHHQVNGLLAAQTRSVHPQQQIDILVDPDRPNHWTDRTHPEPLLAQLLVPLIPAPIPFILLAVALWQRRRFQRAYETGPARTATVVGVTRSAAAPRSAIVRCTVKDHRDKRVIRVAVPRSAIQRLEPGDTLKLITPPNSLTPALAAVIYE